MPQVVAPKEQSKGASSGVQQLQYVCSKWLALAKNPRKEFFDSELNNYGWGWTINSLGISCIAVIISIGIFGVIVQHNSLSPLLVFSLAFLVVTITLFVRFFLAAAIIYMIARLVFHASKDRFGQLTYLMSLYTAPLFIVQSVLWMLGHQIPALWLPAIGIIYMTYIYFTCLTLQSSLQLSSISALAVAVSVMLVPIILTYFGTSEFSSLVNGIPAGSAIGI